MNTIPQVSSVVPKPLRSRGQGDKRDQQIAQLTGEVNVLQAQIASINQRLDVAPRPSPVKRHRGSQIQLCVKMF